MPVAGVDTNVFLRIFIEDGGPQHGQAVALVGSCGQVFVGMVVLVEAVWVLRKLFGFSREKLIEFLNKVLETNAFILENREVVEAALFGFATGPADFADHVILESARRGGAERVYTFDQTFSRVPGACRVAAGKRS